MNIKIDVLDPASIDAAIEQLEQYQQDLKRKSNEIAKRLAGMGAVKVSLDFSRAFYTGAKDISVNVEARDNGYAVIASGETVLFVEFGAGIRYGGGHPEAGKWGMGPGTYPEGKGHWDQPYGWWIPGGEHTYGNPPSMTMYNTEKDLIREIERVAREVFQS